MQRPPDDLPTARPGDGIDKHNSTGEPLVPRELGRNQVLDFLGCHRVRLAHDKRPRVFPITTAQLALTRHDHKDSRLQGKTYIFAPTTAASATPACSNSASSSSAGDTCSPLTLMSSFMRSTT